MLRKLGSYGAFAQALGYLSLLILWMAIYPQEGATEATMMDMNQMLAFCAGHPALLKMQYLIDIVFAAGILCVSLAMFRKFRSRTIDAALLIQATGLFSSLMFLTGGVLGLVGLDMIQQSAGAGVVTDPFTAFMSIQSGIENTGIFMGGWSMFFVAWAGMKAGAWKTWMSACAMLGAAGSILLLPVMLVAPQVMMLCMMLGIFGMVFNAALGFSLSTKAAEQNFELEAAGAK